MNGKSGVAVAFCCMDALHLGQVPAPTPPTCPVRGSSLELPEKGARTWDRIPLQLFFDVAVFVLVYSPALNRVSTFFLEERRKQTRLFSPLLWNLKPEFLLTDLIIWALKNVSYCCFPRISRMVNCCVLKYIKLFNAEISHLFICITYI